MSLSDEEKRKRAAKARKTKTANEKKVQADLDKLSKEKLKTAKLRAELKAIKYLIDKNWVPDGGK